MEVELLPCPFCGNEGRIWVTDDARFVPLCYQHGVRQTCPLKFATFATYQEAAEAWNRRATPA